MWTMTVDTVTVHPDGKLLIRFQDGTAVNDLWDCRGWVPMRRRKASRPRWASLVPFSSSASSASSALPLRICRMPSIISRAPVGSVANPCSDTGRRAYQPVRDGCARPTRGAGAFRKHRRIGEQKISKSCSPNKVLFRFGFCLFFDQFQQHIGG